MNTDTDPIINVTHWRCPGYSQMLTLAGDIETTRTEAEEHFGETGSRLTPKAGTMRLSELHSLPEWEG